MASTINSSTSNGIVITPDTSGEIELQANGVTKAKITANGLQDANGASLRGGSFRNLIINGDMRIDQRNAGASVSLPSSTVVFPSDRFYFYYQMGASSVTTQRVSDAPTDFEYSSKITVGTGDTATASEVALFRQLIEGNNVAHLKCGTADAKTVTLSFWVKSSVTGSYGIGIRNSASNRNYVMTYTISSANTWEKKTLTFTNDTTGTWLKDNGIGLTITWDLGSGSNWHTATTETWDTAGKFTTSSQANLIGTSGATWQITGVQLEVGSGASDFEFLPYDVQLARCQRYYYQLNSTTTPFTITGITAGGNNIFTYWHPVPMRSAPSTTFSGSFQVYSFSSAGATQTGPSNITSITANTNLYGGRFYTAKYGQSGLITWSDWAGTTAVFENSAEL